MAVFSRAGINYQGVKVIITTSILKKQINFCVFSHLATIFGYSLASNSCYFMLIEQEDLMET